MNHDTDVIDDRMNRAVENGYDAATALDVEEYGQPTTSSDLNAPQYRRSTTMNTTNTTSAEDDGEVEPERQARESHHRDEQEHNHNNNNNNNSTDTTSMALRPLFFGNLVQNYSTDRITDLFERPHTIGNLPNKEELQPIFVDRIDIKRGYCFVFFKDATSLEDKRRVESFCMTIQGM
jgi:hypothetical protein